jgi:hypothetical protein
MADRERLDGVRVAPADHEAIRQAILDGTLSPAEALDAWPTDDPRLPLMRAAFEMLGSPTPLEACDSAIERAADAVGNLDADPEAELSRWPADDQARDAPGADLDLEWP